MPPPRLAERPRARSKFPSVQLVLFLVAVPFQQLISADETDFLGEDFVLLVCSPSANSVFLDLHARNQDVYPLDVHMKSIGHVTCCVRVYWSSTVYGCAASFSTLTAAGVRAFCWAGTVV